jgi:MoaA/NifB/PqqE/SkfB family radical SAM enzyme
MRSGPKRPGYPQIATIDFHVTSECSQECPYCWGPRGIKAVSTTTARRIIARVRQFNIRRIVFTGGDPLARDDVGALIRYAKRLGVEVALSTTGDRLTGEFLDACGRAIDLISLPLDGSCEETNALTKQPGHFAAIMRALELLGRYPWIDVKLCTPVTRKNLHDVPDIAALADQWMHRVRNRIFYNVFQTFPRAMQAVNWTEWRVSDAEFASLARTIRRARLRVKINFLSARTLDRLYVLIFPDGRLVIPSGLAYIAYGRFLDVDDLQAVLAGSEFDASKHVRHSRRWRKAGRTEDRNPA